MGHSMKALLSIYTLSFLLKCIAGLTGAVAKRFPVPLILRYLFDRESWSMCEQPADIVQWNVTLLSILLGLSLIEFLICFVQFISGLVSAVCRPCCYKQQYSLSAWRDNGQPSNYITNKYWSSNDRMLLTKIPSENTWHTIWELGQCSMTKLF